METSHVIVNLVSNSRNVVSCRKKQKDRKSKYDKDDQHDRYF